MHVGQAEVATGVAVGEAFMVHAEEMEDGGLEIVDSDDIAGDLFAKFITGTMDDAALDSGPGEPAAKHLGVMPAPTNARVGLEGPRPNSVANTTSVSFIRPRSFRSLSRPAMG